MEDFVDWTKPIRTSEGFPARLICCDRDADNEYIVLYKDPNHTQEMIFSCMKNGCSYVSDRKIVNVPSRTQKIKVFFRVSQSGYIIGVYGYYPDPFGDGSRIVTKEVDVEVG